VRSSASTGTTRSLGPSGKVLRIQPVDHSELFTRPSSTTPDDTVLMVQLALWRAAPIGRLHEMGFRLLDRERAGRKTSPPRWTPARSRRTGSGITSRIHL